MSCPRTVTALEASPLADLHAIASELGIDGFRRLRKADADSAASSSGRGSSGGLPRRRLRPRRARPTTPPWPTPRPRAATRRPRPTPTLATRPPRLRRPMTSDEDAAPRRRRRRDERRRGSGDDDEASGSTSMLPLRTTATTRRRRRRGRVEGAGRAAGQRLGLRARLAARALRRRRLHLRRPGAPLRAGLRRPRAGPVRKPRRSERYPSLVRVDTINGAPAEEVAEGTPYDELPCAHPSGAPGARLRRPDAQGHRVADPDRPRLARGHHRRRAGRARRRPCAASPRPRPATTLELSLVLTGVRPEEAADWKDGIARARGRAALAPVRRPGPGDRARVEQARRVAARGRDAVVLVDGLDGLNAPAARKVLASARNLVDAGSLTIVATASEPVGGETTVIALNQ